MAPKFSAQTRQLLREYGVVVIVAMALALGVRAWVVEAYRVPSSAMRPTLEAGDTIFAVKSALRPGPLGRGEVVVFRGVGRQGNRDFVKRVVGLAGDRVALKGGRLWLNGQSVALPVSAEASRNDELCGGEQLGERLYRVCWDPPLADDMPEEVVPAGSVFVLGDLRSRTVLDPRYRVGWGAIPETVVLARAGWIWLSIESAQGPNAGGWFSRLRFERMFRRIE